MHFYSKYTNCIYPLLITFFLFENGFAQRTVGVFENSPGAYNGYTLLAPSNGNDIYLLDNCGQVVHTWEAAGRPGAVTYLAPDGHIYRTNTVNGAFSGGGQGGLIEKIDWENNVVWSFRYATDDVQQHHDIELLPNGNILILAWELVTKFDAENNFGATDINLNGIWPEHIIEVNLDLPNENNIVWEWHLMDHIIQDRDTQKDNFGVISEHPERIDIHYNNISSNVPDFIHCNSIDYNPELDQIMLSSRQYDELWVIDHSTTTEEAASHEGGKSGKGGDIIYRYGNPSAYDRGTSEDHLFHGQHDAHWIPDGMPLAGSIMVFNNLGVQTNQGKSSVHILTSPVDQNGIYPDLSEDDIHGPSSFLRTIDEILVEGTFSANRISGAQMLENENILICVGTEGILYEVAPTGELLWKYVNPLKFAIPIPYNAPPGGNTIFRAYRYGPEYTGLIGQDLTPGPVLETDVPGDEMCEVFNTTNVVNTQLEGVEINQKGTNEYLITQENTDELLIRLIDLQGRVLGNIKSTGFQTTVVVSSQITGFLLLHVQDKKGAFLIKKIIL